MSSGIVLFNRSLKGISIIKDIKTFTIKSPIAKVIHGTSVLYKDIEKNKNVSINDPNKDEDKGAINHIFFLNKSKTLTSNN